MHDSGDTLDFAATGRLTELRDRNGNKTEFGYDTAGRLTLVKPEVGDRDALTVTVSSDGSTGRLEGRACQVFCVRPVVDLQLR